MSTKTLMTVDQFAHLNTADTEDYELVEGELVPLSSGTPRHAKLRRRVERILERYFEMRSSGEAFGEIDCQVGEETVRRPDVSVFLGERVQRIDLNQIPVPFAPDIAIEVLSPSERAIDVNRKVREYLSAGAGEVWLLDDANGELFVHTLKGIRMLQGEDILETPLLPGFRTTVTELLA